MPKVGATHTGAAKVVITAVLDLPVTTGDTKTRTAVILEISSNNANAEVVVAMITKNATMAPNVMVAEVVAAAGVAQAGAPPGVEDRTFPPGPPHLAL